MYKLYAMLTCSFLLLSLCAPLSSWRGTPFLWLLEDTYPEGAYVQYSPKNQSTCTYIQVCMGATVQPSKRAKRFSSKIYLN